jgi:polar amino acid transport system substrate-binding protein
MKNFTCLPLLLALLSFAASAVELTGAEKAFLRAHNRITIHNEMDWPPFNFNENRQPLGLSIEFMDMLADRLGLEVEYRSGPSWNEFLSMLQAKEIDVMLNIVKTPERDGFTLFTEPYITNPNVIISKTGDRYNSMEELRGKRVAMPEGFFYQELLNTSYPEINQVLTRGQLGALKAVLLGQADAALGELAVVEYLIDRNILNGLVLSGEVDLGVPDIVNLRIGVRNDWPELRSALDKAIKSVSPREMRELQHRWLAVDHRPAGRSLQFSAEEEAYLSARGTVKMCIDPNWMPFESFDRNGRHVGVAADYYDLFEKMLPLRFEAVPVNSWSESLELAQQRKCDILSLAMRTPERSKYLDFTSPYLSIPLVVATRINVPFIEDIHDLEGRTVGIPKGYAFAEIIKANYPGIEVEEVENADAGLEQVRSGKLYACLGTLLTIGNKIQTRYIGEIKITGKLAQKWELGIGVRNDDAILLSVLQKAVGAVSEEQKRAILNKWVSVKYEHGMDYSLVWRIAALAVFIVLVVVYWNRKISRANSLLREARAEIEHKNRQLEMLAVTDKLTGLYNRSKLDEVLGSEIGRSVRYNRTFCVCIVDIDHFKSVNDTHGHQEGDRVLVSFSQLLRAGTRKTDIVGRWGGEEFIIISPETGLDGMLTMAENIRRLIEGHSFGTAGAGTASFGVTCSCADDSPESIIKRADDALYEAKKAGRNRTVSHPC